MDADTSLSELGCLFSVLISWLDEPSRRKLVPSLPQAGGLPKSAQCLVGETLPQAPSAPTHHSWSPGASLGSLALGCSQCQDRPQ